MHIYLYNLQNYQIPEIKTHYNEHADKKNLEEFASGNLKCIINCKKLNEGINNCKKIFDLK